MPVTDRVIAVVPPACAFAGEIAEMTGTGVSTGNAKGVSWFSLQPDSVAAREAQRLGVHDLASELTDFAATAAAIVACDLVITVETCVAHLAGALGRPTWLLLSDWGYDFRWYGPTNASTWWYKSVRLFRQSPGEGWAPVIHRVRDALRNELLDPVTQSI